MLYTLYDIANSDKKEIEREQALENIRTCKCFKSNSQRRFLNTQFYKSLAHKNSLFAERKALGRKNNNSSATFNSTRSDSIQILFIKIAQEEFFFRKRA